MSAANEIRNTQEATTGDFIDFEVLHDGAWKPAQIARTALDVMGASDQSDLQTFHANLDRIAAAAQTVATSAATSEKIRLASHDF